MSYCRFTTDSHVYVYADAAGGITCARCSLELSQDWNSWRVRAPAAGESASGGHTAEDLRETIDHLWRHYEAGDKVPSSAFQGLRDEWVQLLEQARNNR